MWRGTLATSPFLPELERGYLLAGQAVNIFTLKARLWFVSLYKNKKVKICMDETPMKVLILQPA